MKKMAQLTEAQLAEMFVKNLTAFPTFNGDINKYPVWKEKLEALNCMRGIIMTEPIFIQQVFFKLENSAAEWMANVYRTMPVNGNTITNTYEGFLAGLDGKFSTVNLTRRCQEDMWECKQREGENIHTFILRFESIRIKANIGSTDAIHFFE